MQTDRRNRILCAVYCFGMMVLLGASDALRGVFLPVFRETFSLTQTQGSLLIMLSYVSNLLFLLIGGRLVDRVSRRRFLLTLTLLWMAALAGYALTKQAAVLFCGMLLSLGASTMLSTGINLMTPAVFATPALLINVFNFAQGVGISGAQNIGGRFSEHFGAWQAANAILLAGGLLMTVLLFRLRLPEPAGRSSSGNIAKRVFSQPAAKYLLPMVGFYCLAEHGLQNWLVTYGSESLGFSRAQSAKFLSYFFLGITAGRLVFAPLVQRLGLMRSLRYFVTVTALLYIGGMLLGRTGIAAVCLSGLACSVLWPTMVLLIGTYYAPDTRGAATSWITGIANLFDIGFNAGFGALSQRLGLSRAIGILPLCMLLCALSFLLLMLQSRRNTETRRTPQ